MTLRELRGVTKERIILIESNPFFENKTFDAHVAKEKEGDYIVTNLYVDYEEKAIIAEVTHLTYLIE